MAPNLFTCRVPRLHPSTEITFLYKLNQRFKTGPDTGSQTRHDNLLPIHLRSVRLHSLHFPLPPCFPPLFPPPPPQANHTQTLRLHLLPRLAPHPSPPTALDPKLPTRRPPPTASFEWGPRGEGEYLFEYRGGGVESAGSAEWKSWGFAV